MRFNALDYKMFLSHASKILKEQTFPSENDHNIYLQIGLRLAEITNKDSDVVISYMFSIFFAFFQSSVIWGNVISSLVLSLGSNDAPKTEDELNQCGANFCPDTVISGSSDGGVDVDDLRLRVQILSGILLAIGIGAIALVGFFVDPLDVSNRLAYEV